MQFSAWIFVSPFQNSTWSPFQILHVDFNALVLHIMNHIIDDFLLCQEGEKWGFATVCAVDVGMLHSHRSRYHIVFMLKSNENNAELCRRFGRGRWRERERERVHAKLCFFQSPSAQLKSFRWRGWYSVNSYPASNKNTLYRYLKIYIYRYTYIDIHI